MNYTKHRWLFFNFVQNQEQSGCDIQSFVPLMHTSDFQLLDVNHVNVSALNHALNILLFWIHVPQNREKGPSKDHNKEGERGRPGA